MLATAGVKDFSRFNKKSCKIDGNFATQAGVYWLRHQKAADRGLKMK